jgi:hypothetical protein
LACDFQLTATPQPPKIHIGRHYANYNANTVFDISQKYNSHLLTLGTSSSQTARPITHDTGHVPQASPNNSQLSVLSSLTQFLTHPIAPDPYLAIFKESRLPTHLNGQPSRSACRVIV